MTDNAFPGVPNAEKFFSMRQMSVDTVRQSPLQSMWLEYQKSSIPRTAPAMQIVQMRRAFYAGAASFLTLTMVMLSDTKDPNDVMPEDLKLMDTLHAEIEQFTKDMEAGKA